MENIVQNSKRNNKKVLQSFLKVSLINKNEIKSTEKKESFFIRSNYSLHSIKKNKNLLISQRTRITDSIDEILPNSNMKQKRNLTYQPYLESLLSFHEIEENFFSKIINFKDLKKEFEIISMIFDKSNNLEQNDQTRYIIKRIEQLISGKKNEIVNNNQCLFFKNTWNSFFKGFLELLIMLFRRLNNNEKPLGVLFNKIISFFILSIDLMLVTNDINISEKINEFQSKFDLEAMIIKNKNIELEKEVNEIKNKYFKERKILIEKNSNLINERNTLENKLDEIEMKLSGLNDNNEADNACRKMEINIESLKNNLNRITENKIEKNHIYFQGISNLSQLTKEYIAKHKKMNLSNIFNDNINIKQKIFKENPLVFTPNKIIPLIQHPLNFYLINNIENIKLINSLKLDENFNIIQILEDFIDKLEFENLSYFKSIPEFFLEFILKKYDNIFNSSIKITQIINFIRNKKNEINDISKEFCKFFSNILELNNGNTLCTESIYIFNHLRRKIISKLKDKNKILKNLEMPFNINMNIVFESIDESLMNFEIYDEFKQIFEDKLIYEFLIEKEKNEKNPDILQLITRLSDKLETRNIEKTINNIFAIFQELDKNKLGFISFEEFQLFFNKNYQIDISLISISLNSFIENSQFFYNKYLKKCLEYKNKIIMIRGKKIEFYKIQNILYNIFIEIEKNKKIKQINFLEKNYNDLDVFSFNSFSNNLKTEFENEMINNYSYKIFTSLFDENYFFKMNEYFKKIQINEENQNFLDFSKFYNKNIMISKFEEIISNTGFIVSPNPKLMINESKRSRNISFNSNIESNSLFKNQSKLKKRNTMFKQSIFEKNNRNSNAFQGIRLILAKKSIFRDSKSMSPKKKKN